MSSQNDLKGLIEQQSQRGYQDNCIVSDKTSFDSDSPVNNLVESIDDNMTDGGFSEILLKDKVNKGTMTEAEDRKPPECRFCLRRMYVLQKLEKMKSIKGSFYFGPHGKYRFNKQAKRNSGCQTPASLYERAEMTYREMRSLAIILGLRSEKSLRTETFCKCLANGFERDCRCGEEDKCFEWVWDSAQRGEATNLKEQGSLVVFHEDYSCGTTAIRGLRAMDKDQHFWEIKLTTPVYGTDMMIGVGTKNVELNKFHNTFCSMLGYDLDSWGISYDGRIQHAGKKWKYCSRFGQGTIVGIHLDMWHGTLTFFKNRQSLGVAFGGLRGRTLYPMASSTAARSGMRVISSRSFPSSLQFLCCQRLRQSVPSYLSVLDTLPMAPGLRSFLANNMTWLLHVPHPNPPKPSSDHICHICMPLKSALESHTDDGGSSDEERIDRIISFRDSDDDTDDEDLDDFSERSLQRHNLANYLIETSLHSRISRGSSSASSCILPVSSVTPSSPLSSSDSLRPVVKNSMSSSAKKARLDENSFQNEGDVCKYDDDEEESRDEANLVVESQGAKQHSRLGKRKQT